MTITGADIWNIVIATIGGTLGISAAVAFLARLLAGHLLQRDLETYKTELRSKTDRELDEARQRLAAALGKTSKLHEKEFDVIAEVWEKLSETYVHMVGITSRASVAPAFDQMDGDRFRLFVQDCQLDDVDRNGLIHAHDRTEFYSSRIRFYQLRDARKAVSALQSVTDQHGVFIEPALYEVLTTLDARAWDVVNQMQIAYQAPDSEPFWNRAIESRKEFERLRLEFQRAAQSRLGYDMPETTTTPTAPAPRTGS